MSRLHLHVWGPADGPPVLAIHGITGSGARLRALAEEELAGMRVIAPDLRGHGRSTWDPPWTVARHVEDLAAALDDEGIDRAAVLGHSYGGLLAMALAAAAPRRVESLALVDPAAGLAPGRAGEQAEITRGDDGWASVEEARASRLALRPAHARDTVDEDLATFLERDGGGRVRFCFSRPAVIAAWSELAGPVPSLAAWPGRALLVEALRADYLTGALRSSLRHDLGPRLQETAIDAGHMLYWDARPELGAALRRFLAP
jgi:lipase